MRRRPRYQLQYKHPVHGTPTKALPSQRAFHEAVERYRGYFGGFGSGKTLCGCQEAVYQSMAYPDN